MRQHENQLSSSPSGHLDVSSHDGQVGPVKKYTLIGAGILTVITVAAFVLALKILFVITAALLAIVAGTYIYFRLKFRD